MTAGRGRLDRTWLFFGAGIAMWAVADSIYLFQVAEGNYVVGGARSTSAGRSARCCSGCPRGSPRVRERVRDERPPSVVMPVAAGAGQPRRSSSTTTSTACNLLALGLATASIVAMIVRLDR